MLFAMAFFTESAFAYKTPGIRGYVDPGRNFSVMIPNEYIIYESRPGYLFVARNKGTVFQKTVQILIFDADPVNTILKNDRIVVSSKEQILGREALEVLHVKPLNAITGFPRYTWFINDNGKRHFVLTFQMPPAGVNATYGDENKIMEGMFGSFKIIN